MAGLTLLLIGLQLWENVDRRIASQFRNKMVVLVITALAEILLRLQTVSAVVFAMLVDCKTRRSLGMDTGCCSRLYGCLWRNSHVPNICCRAQVSHPIPWWLAIVAGFAVPLFVYMTWSGLGGYSGYSRLGQQVLQDSSGLTIWGWWSAIYSEAVIFGV